jgi:thioredoxin-related protein
MIIQLERGKTMKKTAVIMFVMLLAIAQSVLATEITGTYADAKAEAVSLNKPLLVEFYTEWCGVCKQFAAATNSDPDIQKTLETVLLYRIDAEKGEGKELAKEFKVRAFPTFVMVNGNGAPIDRWLGYYKDGFINVLADAINDPATIDEKLARFQSKPDDRTASALGRYNAGMIQYKDAAEYYRKAQELKSDSTVDYTYDIFQNVVDGVGSGDFVFDDAQNAAKAYLASPQKTDEKSFDVFMQMIQLAKLGNRQEELSHYLQAGLDATANGNDPKIKQTHNMLMVDYSLYIKKDSITAVEYKKAAMPEGWMNNPDDLNEFAWWCLENKINLDEAEALARKGIEFAKPGRGKAAIYDTLAEIVNAKGNAGEAAKLSRKASVEDPQNEYFSRQVIHFEELAKTPIK